MPLVRALSTLAPPLCWSCGALAHEHDPLCPRCRRALRWLGPRPFALGGLAAWAPIAYEGPARALVQALKYRGAVRVADAMAAQIAANCRPELLAGAVLVPVPLHPARRRRRGYNQAERIAAAVARRKGLAAADCLKRRGVGGRARQVGRGRTERLAAGALGISVVEGIGAIEEVVIVDDVVTTGATFNACAQALAAHGTRIRACIAYARTPGR